MASLQNISFSQASAANTPRIRVRFEVSFDEQKTWREWSFIVPNDMFDILPDEREAIARELIFAIARGKGLIDENGNPTG